MNATKNYSIAEPSVDLAAVFLPDTIVSILRDTDKTEVLTRLVESLAYAGRLPWERVIGVVDTLQKRENYGTTGLGNGLAIPHLRCRAVADFTGAIGVAPNGVDFNSLDGLPTRLIILLVSPFEQREKHTAIMGRLATLLSNKTLQYSVQIPRSPEALFRFLGF